MTEGGTTEGRQDQVVDKAPRMMTVVGLMSGTSLDGIDAAIVRTDGAERLEAVAAGTVAYDDGFRMRLRSVLGLPPDDPALHPVARELTERHAAAVNALIAESGVPGIDLIGFHGHTTHHDPSCRITVQIGDGSLLSALTGAPVAYDFRSRDVEVGGQGAPLVPVVHRALALSTGEALPVAVVNIGGVANVTFIPSGGEDGLIAFDSGPGNALIDDWCLSHFGMAVDRDGVFSSQGQTDRDVLDRLMAHPYFSKPAPKSLDRNDFARFVFEATGHLSGVDGAATLAAFTVEALARAIAELPEAPRKVILCGGGRLNPTLSGGLKRRLQSEVVSAEDLGWDGDALEAQAFAYLAVRVVNRQPYSYPGTTGVPGPTAGGRIAWPM